MELKSAKVLDNGRKIVVDLKRKRAAQSVPYFPGATDPVVQRSVAYLRPKKLTRMRSNRSNNKRGSHVNKSLLRNYSNFMKSGLPERIMFYQDGEWTDFPEGFIGLVREDFRLKKAAIEVEVKGRLLLLDFLHMSQIDFMTGLERPIAWIDDAGRCFFPESYSDADESHGRFQSGVGKDQNILYFEPNGTGEIKLQLEIDIVGDDSSKLEESCEESNTYVKRLKIDNNRAGNHYRLGQSASSDPDVEMREATGENGQFNAPFPLQNPTFEPMNGNLNSDAVRQLFLMSMGSFNCAINILEINHSSSYLAQARLELFQKQVEIIKKYRGHANVRYAWLASSKESVSWILTRELGIDVMHKRKPMYGIGIHLTSENCSHISASYCDVDENGVRHMVLCRVIMGKMELVSQGSEQLHPSSENFDSGVDDLQNPKHYVIWNSNMNTHIYPEYVVSFKMSPIEKGCLVPNESKIDVSGVTNSIDSVGDHHPSPDLVNIALGKDLSLRASVPENAKSKDANGPKIPKSPWMPFHMLFAAITEKVPSESMKMLYLHYDQFRRKEICRDELVRSMRGIVGDTLLRSTIIGLQGKYRPRPGCESGAILKQVPEPSKSGAISKQGEESSK